MNINEVIRKYFLAERQEIKGRQSSLGWYTLGSDICQGVPNAYFDQTEWADQRMKNVNKAIIEQSQPYWAYLIRKQYIYLW